MRLFPVPGTLVRGMINAVSQLMTMPEEAKPSPTPEAAVRSTGTCGGAQWWLQLPGGRKMGPLGLSALRSLTREGGGDFLVCREDEGRWRPLREVLGPAAGPNPYAPGRNPLVNLPRSGLLQAVADETEDLDEESASWAASVRPRLERECSRSTEGVELTGLRSIILSDPVLLDPHNYGSRRLRPEVVLMAGLRTAEGECHLLVPRNAAGQLAHEFFSVESGLCPSPLVLQPKSELAFRQGVWLDITHRRDGWLPQLAVQSQPALADGICWGWGEDPKNPRAILSWGLQAVPLGNHGTLHILQTAMQGPLQRLFGVDWYVQRRRCFRQFLDSLPPGAPGEPHFLQGCATGPVLSRLLES